MVNASIPDFKVGALGIEVALTNISVTTFTLGMETISLVPPNALHITTPGVQAEAKMDWRYHDGLIKISGTAVDIINQTSLTLDLEFGSQVRLD